MIEQNPFSIDFDTDTIDAEKEYFANNPEARCPCILLLDKSYSMSGDPLNQLNLGLKQLREELLMDSMTAKRVELSIISFGPITIDNNFSSVKDFDPPILQAEGDTPMGQAVITALDTLEERKQSYRRNNISYYRPWIFLLTDGEPTDNWQLAANRVKAEERKNGLSFFPVGIGNNVNFDILSQFTEKRTPLKMKDLSFREMFVWLSSSFASVSRSQPGDTVEMISPMGWGAVPT